MGTMSFVTFPEILGCGLNLGFPFNPADASYHVTPRSDFKPRPAVKSVLKNGSIRSLNLPLALGSLVAGLIKAAPHEFPRFVSGNSVIGNPEQQVLGEMLQRWVSYLLESKCVRESKLQNTALLISGLHQEVADDHFTKNPSSINEHWLSRMVVNLEESLARDFGDCELNTNEPLAKFLTQYSFIRSSMWLSAIDEAGLSDSYKNMITMAVAAAQSDNVSIDIVKALWLQSFILNDPIPFVMALSGYHISLNEEDLPFLAYEALDNYHRFLSDSDPSGMTNFDYILHVGSALDVCAAITRPRLGTHSMIRDGWNRLFQLKGFTETIDVKHIHASSVIGSITHEVRAARMLFERQGEPSQEIKDDLFNVLNQIQQLTSKITISGQLDMTRLVEIGNELVLATESAESLVVKCDTLFDEFNSLTEELASQRSDVDLLDDESFDKLAKLRHDAKQTKDQLATSKKECERACLALLKLYSALQDEFTRITESPAIDEPSKSLEDEVLTLQEELDTRNLEFKQLQARLFQLEKATTTSNAVSSELNREDALPYGLVEDFMNSSQSLVDVAKLLNAHFKDRLRISPTAWKSMESNKTFCRNAVFFEKMRKLLSADFMRSYIKKGSLGAFEYFTKTELAFRESDTTMSSIPETRQFMFDDNIERECSYHLRIGTSGTRQHMLRIYFTIEDEVIYIGEVTPHLPVSKKR